MFLTSEYLEKKQKYTTLKTELSTALTEHSSYLEQLETAITSAEGKFSGVSTSNGIPNQDTLDKASELVEKLQSLSKKIKSRNDSISDGVTTAGNKAQHYGDLYTAEKQREEDHYKEVARQALEKINRQQEALKNHEIIPR
ncbi:hypothetical protein JZO66_13020 [Enterococcus sp. DIV0242_7C1]|uniref:LXG domain-containing protein n=1 Tax=Candidatus Enterococcus dunnyi TaxID=1834192 RepID=A0A200J625_9ENTE|nr:MULTISPECIES: hypothetical protein [unclassified Enterococcus]MBO0471470.1 hypothetical protein [Enterococcus sp. DIV0242_7C1]OUZ32634.1 hypothetical protein A5889_001343 [Enterococcus sp. 9D6_DIV0238]